MRAFLAIMPGGVSSDCQAADAAKISTETIRHKTGGGNLTTFEAGMKLVPMYSALLGVGAKLGRMNSYGWRDLQRKPTPRDFDAAMLQAFHMKITPVILPSKVAR